MKVLLTGASGFLGRYLLKGFQGQVVTLGRSSENDIVCDLSSQIPAVPAIDMVIHNAGLAHRIPKSTEEEKDFFRTNLTGTQNLLYGLDQSGSTPKSIVYVSTVAVYGLEKGELISESYRPLPKTPYAKSKFEAELLLENWAKINHTNLTILRLPLVVGGIGTPGNLGAMMKAIKAGYYFRIGDGLNQKSMVLAEDIGNFIPRLSDFCGTYNLTDGYNPTLAELDEYLATQYKKKIRRINPKFLNLLSTIGDKITAFPINSYRLAKLTDTLTFDDTKAKIELGWNPRPVIGNLDLETIKK